jgi:hypothetical protein
VTGKSKPMVKPFWIMIQRRDRQRHAPCARPFRRCGASFPRISRPPAATGRSWARVAVLALLALLPGLLAGCVAIADDARSALSRPGDLALTLEGAGRHRVLVSRQADWPQWNALLLGNPSLDQSLQGVRLWDLGGTSLVEWDAMQDAPQAFDLLPGERVVMTTTEADPKVGRPRLLTATMEWRWPPPIAVAAMPATATAPTTSAMPVAVSAIEAAGQSQASAPAPKLGLPKPVRPAPPWPGRLFNAWVQPDGSILMRPPGEDEARIEIVLDAPAPPRLVRLACETNASPGALQAWIQSNDGAWIRLNQSHPLGFEHPLEAKQEFVHWGRRVPIRLSCSRGQGLGGVGGVVTVRRLRVEAQVEAGGGLRPWPAGQAEARLSFGAPRHGRLEFCLMALGAL